MRADRKIGSMSKKAKESETDRCISDEAVDE
jgi:hypothetical protein